MLGSARVYTHASSMLSSSVTASRLSPSSPLRADDCSRAFSSAVRPNLKPLRVGGVPEHFNTPWHTAAAAGRFEELGLAFEWKEYPGGTGAMCRDLRSDEIDLAVLLTEGIYKDIVTGGNSKIAGVYVSSPLCWGIHCSAGDHHERFEAVTAANRARSRDDN